MFLGTSSPDSTPLDCIYEGLMYYFFQLSDAVSMIGREDFPDKWKNLLPVSTLKCKSNVFLGRVLKMKSQMVKETGCKSRHYLLSIFSNHEIKVMFECLVQISF